ncbi:TNT domain-containing protein [Streptomyces sp. RKAG290]|uniref:TNT domain-containing protein n=1 Tax=Streptomyces sp. RKAG290 TaxID=2888348 RepID=UPI002034A6A1|nr:TNT domain-containing protein [Streptomyces sp. RKAG290]MCM2411079.1 TNT domain-containing protein [Streptomyces sp. RKAG290]
MAPTAAHADSSTARPGIQCPTDERGRGTNKAPEQALERYYHDDWRLGPRDLPKTGPIGKMLRGYNRTGRVSQYWFLGCYWQTNPVTNTSGWWYPDNDGFVLDRQGKPEKKSLKLRVGQLVDLFGSGFGNFLAPAGTPYAKRAIPPSNLVKYTTAYPSSYHLYRVLKAFTVEAGPIRPWFGQPGLGIQYRTAKSIPDLVAAEELKALN